MAKSNRNLLKVAEELFDDASERDEFLKVLQSQSVSKPALIWTQDRPKENPFEVRKPLPWQAEFVDCLLADQAPGQSDLHAAGAYYCLDLSSVFQAAVLSEVSSARRILDVCASPGGKAIYAWRLFQPDELICNEVIPARVPALIANLKRCQITNWQVTSVDSKKLIDRVGEEFDLVIIDAPCSGQSLYADGMADSGVFHPVLINKCANRQKHILAEVSKLIKSGGYLAYMTCTFSVKENESVLEWFVKKFPEFSVKSCDYLAEYRSTYSELVSYRLFPHQRLGRGGFCALLMKS